MGMSWSHKPPWFLLHNAFWALADEDEAPWLEVGRGGKGWDGVKGMGVDERDGVG